MICKYPSDMTEHKEKIIHPKALAMLNHAACETVSKKSGHFRTKKNAFEEGLRYKKVKHENKQYLIDSLYVNTHPKNPYQNRLFRKHNFS